MNSQDFNSQAIQFLEQLFGRLEKNKIQLEAHWSIDHLCYRVSSQEDYEKYKTTFSQFSDLLIETPVFGRLISTYKLLEPVKYKHWVIDVVELPAPKKGKITKHGFEHIEVVIDQSFDYIKEKYKHCKFDESGLSKDFNQELEISLGDMAIKFHHLSLESVVRIEKNSLLLQSIKELNILIDLKELHPLISGTFPLGLNIESSDIDLLISADDLSKVERQLVGLYQNFDSFQLYRKSINGEDSLICAFNFNKYNFELFVQKLPSVRQNGNLHFLAEEKILKLINKNKIEEIINFKNLGLKTEPAFAKMLNIYDDPYIALLNLQKLSEKQLAESLQTS